MDSRRELLLKAVLAKLSAPEKPPSLTVSRNRRTPTEERGLPEMSLYLGSVLPGLDEKIRTQNRHAADRELFFTVRVTATGDDEAMDPFAQWALQAATVTQVGDKGVEIEEEGSVWIYAEGSDFDYLTLETIFRARYVTRRADLTL